VTRIGDEAQIINESDPYPVAGVGEDWIQTPTTKKRGEIVYVTKEAIFFDRTGLVLQRAGEVGLFLGLNKEKRAIDCIIDENTTAHRYNWRGTTYATYQSSTPWDNVTASNALVDFTDIDNANQTFNGILDPNTGEPILVSSTKKLICTQQLEITATHIRNATEVTVVTPGFATSNNPSERRGGNPVGGKFDVVTSALLGARLATDTSWFYGDPSKAFKYMQNWPITVEQMANTSDMAFTRDVVTGFKASERGAFVVVEPRQMQTCTA
jgi:hypothetical protein